MTTSIQDIARIACIGILATAVMDVWTLGLRRMGVPTLDMALVGRWIGHLPSGRFAHAPIGRSGPVKGERLLGWLTHYAVGIAFAALMALVGGPQWLASPALLPALAVGIATVAAPWLVMQPAMGSGIAASRTPTPWRNRARSLANHTVFGLGLYLAAVLLNAPE